jgi:Polynucleotide kinase 3 phosphatase
LFCIDFIALANYLFFSSLLFSSLRLSYLLLSYLLSNSGKRLAIISNQNGIRSKKTSEGEVQGKVDAIMAELGIPLDFICALDDDLFKKPRTGIPITLSFIILYFTTTPTIYIKDASANLSKRERAI